MEALLTRFAGLILVLAFTWSAAPGGEQPLMPGQVPPHPETVFGYVSLNQGGTYGLSDGAGHQPYLSHVTLVFRSAAGADRAVPVYGFGNAQTGGPPDVSLFPWVSDSGNLLGHDDFALGQIHTIRALRYDIMLIRSEEEWVNRIGPVLPHQQVEHGMAPSQAFVAGEPKLEDVAVSYNHYVSGNAGFGLGPQDYRVQVVTYDAQMWHLERIEVGELQLSPQQTGSPQWMTAPLTPKQPSFFDLADVIDPGNL